MNNNNKNNGHVSLQFPMDEKANTTANIPKPITKPEAKTEVKPEVKKKEIPSQIDDVEKELEKLGLYLCALTERKDKDGNDILTKKGKVAGTYSPFRIGRMWVSHDEKENRYHLRFWWKEDNDGVYRGRTISEKDYKKWMKTSSIRKRLSLALLKIAPELKLKKIKNTKGIFLRISENDYLLLQELSSKIGKRKVSELIRNRVRGTILHEALSTEEKRTMNALLQMATELKQYGTALKNYLKTTGTAGVQRLDLLFQSKAGTDYAMIVLEAAKKINKIIKYDN